MMAMKGRAIRMRKLAFVVAVLAIVSVVAGNAFATKTLDNLQTAFNGESNAHARYVAFAVQADKEGYAELASMFRAAARAEEIHAANHAVVIRKMGGTPQANIVPAEVKLTSDNVVVAMKGEIYERDVMYPDFIKQARAEHNTDALQTFNYAKNAETEHARLYTEAKDNLPQMKTKGIVFYVCTVCGYTTKKMDFEKCPSCFNPKDKYVPVA
jgi:rubrerythrin